MQIFRLLTARMKINQILYVIFQATSQFSVKFCITLQCHDTIPLKLCFGQKKPINVQFFKLLSAQMKVHLIPHAIFETSRSIRILHHCSQSCKITPLFF